MANEITLDDLRGAQHDEELCNPETGEKCVRVPTAVVDWAVKEIERLGTEVYELERSLEAAGDPALQARFAQTRETLASRDALRGDAKQAVRRFCIEKHPGEDPYFLVKLGKLSVGQICTLAVGAAFADAALQAVSAYCTQHFAKTPDQMVGAAEISIGKVCEIAIDAVLGEEQERQ